MSVGQPGTEEAPGTTGTSAVLKPAGSYDEPQVVQYVLPAGVPVLICTRDFSRAMVWAQLFTPFPQTDICLDSLCQIPIFTMTASSNNTLIRYVDYLTICTSDLYALSPAGAVLTVVTVREQ